MQILDLIIYFKMFKIVKHFIMIWSISRCLTSNKLVLFILFTEVSQDGPSEPKMKLGVQSFLFSAWSVDVLGRKWFGLKLYNRLNWHPKPYFW